MALLMYFAATCLARFFFGKINVNHCILVECMVGYVFDSADNGFYRAVGAIDCFLVNCLLSYSILVIGDVKRCCCYLFHENSFR